MLGVFYRGWEREKPRSVRAMVQKHDNLPRGGAMYAIKVLRAQKDEAPSLGKRKKKSRVPTDARGKRAEATGQPSGKKISRHFRANQEEPTTGKRNNPPSEKKIQQREKGPALITRRRTVRNLRAEEAGVSHPPVKKKGFPERGMKGKTSRPCDPGIRAAGDLVQTASPATGDGRHQRDDKGAKGAEGGTRKKTALAASQKGRATRGRRSSNDTFPERRTSIHIILEKRVATKEE